MNKKYFKNWKNWVAGGFLSLFPLSLGATANMSSSPSEPNSININKESKKSSLENTVSYASAQKKQSKKKNTFYEGGNDGNNQDRIEGDRYIHITPEGHRIVSWKDKESMDRAYSNMVKEANKTSLKSDPIYDTTDPKYGLVPGVPRLPPGERSVLVELMGPSEKVSTVNQRIEERGLFNESHPLWNCEPWSGQNANIDAFGIEDIEDIENSGLTAHPDDPYNYSTNGVMEFDGYVATTKTSSGAYHGICATFKGSEDPRDRDVTDFSQWEFWEPQKPGDAEESRSLEPGDYSLRDHAHIQWFGKYQDKYTGEWLYNIKNIIKPVVHLGNVNL